MGMTYREKLREEHPGMLNIDAIHRASTCPDELMDIRTLECCGDCRKCWDTEMEGT